MKQTSKFILVSGACCLSAPFSVQVEKLQVIVFKNSKHIDADEEMLLFTHWALSLVLVKVRGAQTGYQT